MEDRSESETAINADIRTARMLRIYPFLKGFLDSYNTTEGRFIYRGSTGTSPSFPDDNAPRVALDISVSGNRDDDTLFLLRPQGVKHYLFTSPDELLRFLVDVKMNMPLNGYTVSDW